MTNPTRYSTAPIVLPLPLEADPAPVDGCAGCAELVNVRERARAVGDLTTVTDCNIHLRRHPEGHR
ncbi:hypothetical protein ADK86_38210 [Streptomyces sp. NRRL F-5755]|uniref:hypothetical protein n=1 Tax=Streptomyces sp. NRRL F-5755 TaxID=1519475 RepID=UPI0006AEC1DE|nr:hypothetical protein [Streptomyces sp. NRRL F-5755]KOT86752.1 hypothetical protein ADK86_38210 [Streptomyces sp. NRRL F-5755]